MRISDWSSDGCSSDLEDRPAGIVADGGVLQGEDRRRQARGLGKMEGDRAVLHHRGDRPHAGQRLEAGLRLARLGGLVAEAVDEGLAMAPLGLLLGMLGGLVLQVLAAPAHAAVVVAGIGGKLAVLPVTVAVPRTVVRSADVRDPQQRGRSTLPDA